MCATNSASRSIHLWLGKNAHLVHYPVSAGRLINIVAIVDDNAKGNDWSAPGRREDILKYFAPRHWATAARDLINEAEQWQTWSLYDRPARWRWGHGAMTMLGDAAHPALPFIAQGAAMAIEDAATLAQCLSAHGVDPVQALRLYEGVRRRRVARVQRDVPHDRPHLSSRRPTRRNTGYGHCEDGRRKAARALRLAL